MKNQFENDQNSETLDVIVDLLEHLMDSNDELKKEVKQIKENLELDPDRE